MSDIPRGPVATALAIAEIQLQIFSLIEKSDSARCARVCRRWQKAALDRVWSSVDSLVFLVQLLAPLRLEPGSRNPLVSSKLYSQEYSSTQSESYFFNVHPSIEVLPNDNGRGLGEIHAVCQACQAPGDSSV